MKVKKSEYTKAELMLYLYDIPFSFIADIFGNKDQKRKYQLIFEGKYQRIDLTILDNICNFLNVTPGVGLDGLLENDSFKVYIKNINTWIDYDTYILLRSVGIVEDLFKKEEKTIEHNVSFKVASELLYKRNGFNSLIKYGVASFTKILDPIEVQVKELGRYCHNKEKYINQIKPYLLKFMDEETFKKKLLN